MKAGHYALAQPTIRPLFDTQQFQDVLLRLSGQNIKILRRNKGALE
jgi:molybdopterin-containing oxidoreductase family iron-sulfur binding subunit